MVPGGNPGADVGSEGVHAAVDAAFDELSAEFGNHVIDTTFPTSRR